MFAGTGGIVISDVFEGMVTHFDMALTFGPAVAAMIHTFGNACGAHINAAVTVGLWPPGQVTGASMNAVRSLGPAIIAGQTQHLWVYVTATILSALIACWGFQIVQRASNSSPRTTK